VIDMRKKNEGFTLVELMVTVTLLAFFGLVLAKSIGTSSWLAHYRLKGAARDLASSLEKARANALKENREWGVAFDTGTNTYALQSSGVDRKMDTVADNTTPEGNVSLAAYKNGIKFGRGGVSTPPSMGTIGNDVTFPGNLVTFDGRGLPIFGQQGFCYLSNDEGAVYAVGVLPSGVVRVQRWTGTTWK